MKKNLRFSFALFVVAYALSYGVYTWFLVAKGRSDHWTIGHTVSIALAPIAAGLIGRKITWRICGCYLGLHVPLWLLLPATAHSVDRTALFWLCWGTLGALLAGMVLAAFFWQSPSKE